MPKAIAIDKNEVLATYKATGSLADTAKAHGLGYSVVKQWAKRYDWPTPTRILKRIEGAKQELQAHNEKQGLNVTIDAKEAIPSSIEKNRDLFVSGMASGLARAAQVIGESDGAEVLASSRDVSNIVSSARTIFNLGSDSDAPKVQINLLNADVSSLRDVSLALPR